MVSCLLGLHVWFPGRDASGILRQDWELGERGVSCHSMCPLRTVRPHHLSEGAASREAKGTDWS